MRTTVAELLIHSSFSNGILTKIETLSPKVGLLFRTNRAPVELRFRRVATSVRVSRAEPVVSLTGQASLYLCAPLRSLVQVRAIELPSSSDIALSSPGSMYDNLRVFGECELAQACKV